MERKTPAQQEPVKLPTLQELFSDDVERAGKSEGLKAILNAPPPKMWIPLKTISKVFDLSDKELTPEQTRILTLKQSKPLNK